MHSSCKQRNEGMFQYNIVYFHRTFCKILLVLEWIHNMPTSPFSFSNIFNNWNCLTLVRHILVRELKNAFVLYRLNLLGWYSRKKFYFRLPVNIWITVMIWMKLNWPSSLQKISRFFWTTTFLSTIGLADGILIGPCSYRLTLRLFTFYYLCFRSFMVLLVWIA